MACLGNVPKTEFKCPGSCSREHNRKYMMFGVIILTLNSQLCDLLALCSLLQNSEKKNTLHIYFMNQVERVDERLESSSGTLSNLGNYIYTNKCHFSVLDLASIITKKCNFASSTACGRLLAAPPKLSIVLCLHP